MTRHLVWCERLRRRQPHLNGRDRWHVAKAIVAPEEPITRCGFCAAEMPESQAVAHDIACHDGLGRTRSTHRVLCDLVGKCICRVEEYERAAKSR